ncbi:MAG TPA: hypothetical protein VGH19_18645 [Verrucomicrobiae bacterium]
MSDELFRGMVASSLAMNHYQQGVITGQLEAVRTGMSRVETGLAGVHQGLSQVAQEVRAIADAMALARDQQNLQAFWRENIFVIRKGLEAGQRAVGSAPHRAYYLAVGFEAYMQREGLSSRTFEQINEKEYWDATLKLCFQVRQEARALLSAEEAEAIEFVVIAQNSRALLFKLWCWARTLEHLRPWWMLKSSLPSGNPQLNAEYRRQRERLSKICGMVNGLATGMMQSGCLTVIVAVIVGTIAEAVLRGSSILLIGGFGAALYFLNRSYGRKLAQVEAELAYVPPPPAAAANILTEVNWNVAIDCTPEGWQREADGLAAKLRELGLEVSGTESAHTLGSLVEQLDAQIDSWRERLLYS